MPVLIDARNDGVDLVLTRGTARNVVFLWPGTPGSGSIAGRTFTAMLNGVPLTVTPFGEALIVTVSVAQTLAAAAGPLPFVVTETTGVDQPIIQGTWRMSNNPKHATPPGTINVTVEAATVTVTVPSGTEFPEIASSDPAKMPVSTVGGVTTLDVDNLAWFPVASRLTADTAGVTASTVLVNSGLSVALTASATYMIDGLISYNSGGTAGDLKLGWSGVPAGTVGFWTAPGLGSGQSADPGTIRVNAATLAAAIGLGGLATDTAVRINAVFVVSTTPGTVNLQYAQNTSDAATTLLRAHSLLVATRVA